MGVNLSSNQIILLDCFNKLTVVDQQSLLSFAEFLSARVELAPDSSKKSHQTPELLPRPVDESVPKAIKRLSLSYPMLQDEELLHQCSALMSEHILKGRAAINIVDELELLFRQSYKKLSE